MRQPMPILSEKKAWPIALKTTDESIFEKSGLKRNDNPSEAPGRVIERTHRAIRIRKSIGIITFEALSMPSFTPETIMICVSAMKTTVQRIGRNTPVEKAVNSSAKSVAFLPSSEPLKAWTMYSSVQPETTA